MSDASSNPGKQALIIFIKNPEAGKVKTRLANGVGDENALAIYKYLLDHTRQMSLALPVKRFLFYDHRIDFADEWPEQHYEKAIQSCKRWRLLFNWDELP